MCRRDASHQLGAAETVGNAISQQVFEDKFIKTLKRLRGQQKRGFQVECSSEGNEGSEDR